jgi:hypothetical protein
MEATIRQNEDGTFEVEIMGEDGQPQVMPVENVQEAMAAIEGAFGGGEGEAMPEEMPAEEMPPEGEEMAEEMPEEMPEESGGVVAASKGKTLEENIPAVDKEKYGARSKKRPNWDDYGV